MRNVSSWFKILAAVFTVLLIPHVVLASTGLSLQGRILKADNTPVTSNNVQFRIQIRSPGAEDCLLYEETQTVNMSSSLGMFQLTVGSGARPSALIDGGYAIDKIFSNASTIDLSATAPAACASG